MIRNKGPAAPIPQNRWDKYLMASAVGVLTSLLPQVAFSRDNCTKVDVDVLIEDQTIDRSFETFGPYTFGASGASFAFQHAFSETGPSLGILAARGYGDISFVGFVGGGTFYGSNLDWGSRVGPSQIFGIGKSDGRVDLAWGGSTGASQFLDVGLAYLGFRFDVGNGTQYGWAELDMVDGNPQNRATFLSYTYADPGYGVFIRGEGFYNDCSTFQIVPEPSALCALAMGSVGVLAWRRKRDVVS